MSKKTSKINSSAGLTVHRIICYICLIIAALISLFPFYLMMINATRSHAEIQSSFTLLPGSSLVTNFRNLYEDPNMPVLRSLGNSLFVSTCSAFLTIYFSALTAYGIYAYSFKFKKLAYTFILLIMMVPTQVSALGFVNLMRDFGLNDTFWPLILPGIAAPMSFFFIKQNMESSLPLEIVEAARIDGGNEFYNFNKVIFPILKPSMAVQAIFTFVGSWNNYFMPALILESNEKKTLPILVAQLRSADYAKFDMGKVYMLLAVTILPLIFVYLILSKFIIRGITLGSVKG